MTHDMSNVLQGQFGRNNADRNGWLEEFKALVNEMLRSQVSLVAQLNETVDDGLLRLERDEQGHLHVKVHKDLVLTLGKDEFNVLARVVDDFNYFADVGLLRLEIDENGYVQGLEHAEII